MAESGDIDSTPTSAEHVKRDKLAETIERRLHDIESRWLTEVRREIAARGQQATPTDLRDAIDEYLIRLATAVRGGESIEAGGRNAWADVAREHALTRVRLGFDIDQLVHEFILLRRVMFQVAREERLIDNDYQSERLTDLIDEAIAASVQSYIKSRDLATRREQAEHVAFLTHEMRNPLATVIMAASRLRSRPDIVAAEGATLDMIDRGLSRMRSLIDKVLLTERFEAQEMECRPIDINLGRIMIEALQVAQFEAVRKGVGFNTRFDPDLRIHVDPGLTISALQNVVENALKFTDWGFIEVTAEDRAEDVVIHVYDNCDGLSPEELTTIFEPFKRAHPGKPGTGLGLAIARRALEAQEGGIGVESEGERGCHFWVRLPKPSK